MMPVENTLRNSKRRNRLSLTCFGLVTILLLSACAGNRTGDTPRFVGPDVGNPLFGGFRIESELSGGAWQHYLIVRKDDDVYPGLAPRVYDRARLVDHDVEIIRMAEAFTHCPGPCARHYEIIVPIDLIWLDHAANGAGLPVRLFLEGCDCPPFDLLVGPDYARDYLRGFDRRHG